jgi:hypothetical protein
VKNKKKIIKEKMRIQDKGWAIIEHKDGLREKIRLTDDRKKEL